MKIKNVKHLKKITGKSIGRLENIYHYLIECKSVANELTQPENKNHIGEALNDLIGCVVNLCKFIEYLDGDA